jgi:hypothetical protein
VDYKTKNKLFEIIRENNINIFEFFSALMTEPSNPIQDQFGPCGILCGSCPLGSGAAADSADQTRKHITDCQIPMWSPFVVGGEAIDWAAVDRALEWMTTYARCAFPSVLAALQLGRHPPAARSPAPP